MALVSGGRSSTLNPNAPLFIPAAVRQVEDFSPEWWQLVTTSTWFHDYWVSQHMGEDGFYGNDENEFDGHNDIADLLPDTIDLGIDDDDFASMDAQFEEFIQSSQIQQGNMFSLSALKGMAQNGIEVDPPMKELSVPTYFKERSPRFPAQAPKYWEKPAKPVSPKSSNRRIQQPR